jgi:phage N-6-adenine-methyltransferase
MNKDEQEQYGSEEAGDRETLPDLNELNEPEEEEEVEPDEEETEAAEPTAPRRKRRATKQTYRTPLDFLEAVAERFGVPTFDLAATDGEQIETATGHFTPEQDSLAQDWAKLDGSDHRVVWLNPPFRTITPWAEKLVRECADLDRVTLFFVPASVGSVWFSDHLFRRSLVLAVSPRVAFRGEETPIGKDMILVAVGRGVVPDFDVWRWKARKVRKEKPPKQPRRGGRRARLGSVPQLEVAKPATQAAAPTERKKGIFSRLFGR